MIWHIYLRVSFLEQITLIPSILVDFHIVNFLTSLQFRNSPRSLWKAIDRAWMFLCCTWIPQLNCPEGNALNAMEWGIRTELALHLLNYEQSLSLREKKWNRKAKRPDSMEEMLFRRRKDIHTASLKDIAYALKEMEKMDKIDSGWTQETSGFR